LYDIRPGNRAGLFLQPGSRLTKRDQFSAWFLRHTVMVCMYKCVAGNNNNNKILQITVTKSSTRSTWRHRWWRAMTVRAAGFR